MPPATFDELRREHGRDDHGRFDVGESVYHLRRDVRDRYPLALTPAQRGDYLRWFLQHGRNELDADPADLLCYLAALDAAPDRGLVATYKAQPEWQLAVPDALTVAGWMRLKRWVRSTYGIRDRWLRDARLEQPLKEEAGGPGVNVVGLFRYPSGLQAAADEMVRSLNLAGVRTSLRDIPLPNRRDGRPRAGFDGLEPHPVTIVTAGLDFSLPEVYAQAGLARRPGVYRVGLWWWELERVPPEWLGHGADVDEVWAPTTFIADAVRALGKPVRVMLPSVTMPDIAPRPKSAFGLDPARFTFSFAFDLRSRLARKNPLGPDRGVPPGVRAGGAGRAGGQGATAGRRGSRRLARAANPRRTRRASP